MPTFGSLGSELFLGIGFPPQLLRPLQLQGKLFYVLAALSSSVLLPTLCHSMERDRGPHPFTPAAAVCLLAPLLGETPAFSFQLSKGKGTIVEHTLDSG